MARSTRLTVEDWVNAAFDLLVAEGVAGVKISRLCEQLGVTKGSFYWHFTDIDALMVAVAHRWQELQAANMARVTELGSLPPAERIVAMAGTLFDERVRAVEVAMREWARSDATVADAVRAMDRLVVTMVRDALIESGFDQRTAEVRAAALLFAGIGFLHNRDALGPLHADELHEVFAVFTAR
ncbi:TetR/AcrR family transcriptional regulator [Williamsia herbipolensis]|uniref:TetR/AcrR family transcriptional regulator n=1 Tax=Williamsia herbipolensis TaxID=1603258 RepID=UPI0005F776D7|nr:TetR/AcrR family transcriptional regulator [Williamsia herbipolensis]